MSRPVKIVIWVVVFLVCAGAGAYVAANTDPFPPGVDPGARPTPTGTSSTPPPTQPTAFAVELRSETRHELHVGGSCDTDWEATFRVTVDDSAAVTGEATARLVGDAVCTFDQAQIQATSITLDVTGSYAGGVLRLRFSETKRDPLGSRELGGFAKTLPLIRPAITPDGGSSAPVVAEKGDGDRGTFSSVTDVRASCKHACD